MSSRSEKPAGGGLALRERGVRIAGMLVLGSGVLWGREEGGWGMNVGLWWYLMYGRSWVRCCSWSERRRV